MDNVIGVLSRAIVLMRQSQRDASNEMTKRQIAIAITQTEDAILRIEASQDHTLLPA
jgi:hypothetical protein